LVAVGWLPVGLPLGALTTLLVVRLGPASLGFSWGAFIGNDWKFDSVQLPEA